MRRRNTDELAIERELEDRLERLGTRGFRLVPCAEALVLHPTRDRDGGVLPAAQGDGEGVPDATR